MREPNDLTGFGPVRTEADKWRDAFIALLVLVLLGIAAHYGHGRSDAIPSQAWSFGEPGE